MLDSRTHLTYSDAPFNQTNPWIYCPIERPDPRLRLICFPYAGGSATIFRTWANILPSHVELVAIELPGRQRRFCEPFIEDMDGLLEELVPLISKLGEVPFSFFGHSMGGRIAFELTRRLQACGAPMPEHLFVSASTPPNAEERSEPLHTLSDADLVEELKKLGGIPDAVLAHPELLALVTPTLRADIKLVENLPNPDFGPAVCVPITVFGGKDDGDAPDDLLRGWSRQTTAGFKLKMFPGDHFFIRSEETRLLGYIDSELSNIIESLCDLCA